MVQNEEDVFKSLKRSAKHSAPIQLDWEFGLPHSILLESCQNILNAAFNQCSTVSALHDYLYVQGVSHSDETEKNQPTAGSLSSAEDLSLVEKLCNPLCASGEATIDKVSSQLANTAEHLAVKEPDVSIRSRWRPKKELNAYIVLCLLNVLTGSCVPIISPYHIKMK